MIVLTETTDNLQVVLTGAITTNQLRCYTSYRDITTTGYTPGRTGVNTNNTTDVDIVGSPAASTQRVVDTITIYNHDTANAEVTVKLDDNGTEYILVKVTLGPAERLEYVDGMGFSVYTSAGALKNSLNQGNNATSSSMSSAVLGADVTNNNATANTIADVTGLSFPVVTGNTYWFRFSIHYTSAATTTGSRWSINGPTTSMLRYRSQYSLTATSDTFNTATAYDIPAASNATSASTAGNIALIEGYITPTADGNVIARFASEISGSAIVAKAGSTVHYQEVI